MKLPNAARAVIDQNKLIKYCLSLEHPIGKHKARVFADALGLTSRDAEVLRTALVGAADSKNAVPSARDDYGQRYVIDFILAGPKGTAEVRSVWIVLADEDFPRLVTCYVR